MTLLGKMAIGAVWMVAARFCIKFIGIISTLILVRLLLPSDFGLVALATAFVAGLEIIKRFSFDIVLIQDQQAKPEKYNTAWTVNLGFSLFIAAIISSFAIPISQFYSDERLVPVLYALALSMSIQGLQNIGIVNFRKDMEFHKEFMFQFIKKISSFIVTISLAFTLRSYWALVAGIVASAVAGTASSYIMQSFKPRLCISEFRELFNFSKWLVLNNILYFIRHRAADLVLGKLRDSKAVGLYSVSYEISHLVSAELVAPINRAVFSGYAKISHDLAEIRKTYLQVMSVIALVSFPAATGIAAIADILVPVVLGEKWESATPLIQILAFSGGVAVLETNIGAVYLALGRPQILTLIYTVFCIVFLTLLLTLIPLYGVIGAAYASLLAGLINIPLQLYLMKRVVGIALIDILKIFYRPLLASFTMYAVLRMMIEYFEAGDLPQAVMLVAGILCGAIVYIIAELLLWLLASQPRGAESYMLKKVRSFLLRRQQPA